MVSELEEGKKLLLDEIEGMKQQIATLEGDLVESKKNANEKQTALQSELSAVTAAKETTEEELVSLLNMNMQIVSSHNTLHEQ
jgi:predicted  nucleic acid-binding Zn-ribbon protein